MADLQRLLRPRSIAVFGGVQAAAVIEQSRKMGFDGQIWPVHPVRDEVAGLQAYRSVDRLPGVPDAAFVGVNRAATIEIVRQLQACGAGGAICYASGFAEAKEGDRNGVNLQADLVAAAGEMAIIGPNCYGLINYCDGALMWPDQHGGRRLRADERGVAVITQSSNIAINMTMQKRGLPIAYLLAAGNQAQTGLSQIALALIEEERVSALGLHIEAFDTVCGFEQLAARARELKKPIVALKSGRSAQARAATISHTASLAGSDAASTAFLARLGIARVFSLPAMLETLKLLHAFGPLPGFRLGSMSCSGGEAALMADTALGHRVHFPALEPSHALQVRRTLGPLVTPANPLDYHTFVWNDEAAMSRAFSCFLAGGFDLNLLVLDFPRADRCSDSDWWPAVRAFERALRQTDARGAIVSSLSENIAESCAGDLLGRNLVALQGLVEAMEAADAAAFIGAAWQAPVNAALARPLPVERPAGARPTRMIDEASAKALLADAGLPILPGQVARVPEAAVAAGTALGFPVALKVLGMAHKSDHGAVVLDLGDRRALGRAAAGLAHFQKPFYVERMVRDGVAELIVGVVDDPQFGPVMTVGSGGVLVELTADRTTLLLPVTREQIDQALRGLDMFPLLDGFRGRDKADLASVVDAVHSIAAFALANAGRLAELEINPLIVCAQGKGCWIADALMTLSSEAIDPKRAAGADMGLSPSATEQLA